MVILIVDENGVLILTVKRERQPPVAVRLKPHPTLNHRFPTGQILRGASFGWIDRFPEWA
ncbi:MAG: hypothetical protein ABI147_05935 [Acidobacteriaceae bacterium]